MKKSKTLIILGSPRKKGNTAILAEKVSEGIIKAGGEVESIFLHNKQIKPCSHCNSCKTKEGYKCSIKDDMQDIYPKIREANTIILTSPVYWFNYTAQLKLFIDRCYANNYSKNYALKNKDIGIIMTYGASTLQSSGGIHGINSLKEMFDYTNCNILKILHGSAYEAGEIRSNQKLMEKAYQFGFQIGHTPDN
ncbi:flavodoxin family protein [Candidatus Lokiarchaeum ossiferum]|uniref:flavodoxin family protein n=1 Tax=Candidatus Lokiarchaeum ossiferum TaxID=2951803 RepID=UPI00352F039E